MTDRYWNLPGRPTQAGPQLVRPALPRPATSDAAGYPFLNNSGETIPAHGIFAYYQFATEESEPVLAPDGRPYLDARQASSYPYEYAVNGASAVVAGATGLCTLPSSDQPVVVLGDPGETFAMRDLCGPAAGQWFLRRNHFPICRVIGVLSESETATQLLVHFLQRPDGWTYHAAETPGLAPWAHGASDWYHYPASYVPSVTCAQPTGDGVTYGPLAVHPSVPRKVRCPQASGPRGRVRVGKIAGMQPVAYGGSLDDVVWEVWPGLLGYRVVSDPTPETIGGETVWVCEVVASPNETAVGIAASHWSNQRYSGGSAYVTIHPMAADGSSYVYDGAGDYPLVTLRVELLYPYIPYEAPRWSPNVREGDRLSYRAIPYGEYSTVYGAFAMGYMAVGSYLDDPIGTVKLWNGLTSNIPPGWRQVGNTGDFLRIGSLGSGSFGASGSAYAYRQFIAIERYE